MTIDKSNLPDFFILGATKCGTTSLHHYVRQHPKVYMPYSKELYFFNKAGDTQEEVNEYLKYFDDTGDCVTGEATPGYFRRPDIVIPRMMDLYGGREPHFVVLFRDPVQRAYSNYMHNVRLGREDRSFEQALRDESDDLADSRRNWRSYFRDGLYAETLSTWYDHFSPEHFLVVLTDDLKEDAAGATRRVYEFLNLDSGVSVDTDRALNRKGGGFKSRALRRFLGSPPSLIRHIVTAVFSKPTRRNIRQFLNRLNNDSSESKEELDPVLARRLRKRYREPTRELAEMIGRDLSHWLPA